MTLEDAVQHLYHFCATLPSDPYVDRRPEFCFSEFSSRREKERRISAKVILPNTVDATVRETKSQSYWVSEKYARRDAAFEAYIKLYKAGLVSDHLLPLRGYDETVAEAQKDVEKIVKLVDVQDQLAVWRLIAQAWQASIDPQASAITIAGQSMSQMLMLLPCKLSRPTCFDLYWDKVTTLSVTITPCPDSEHRYDLREASTTTGLLLRSVFGGRMETERDDFLALFVFTNKSENNLDELKGTYKADDLIKNDFVDARIGIIRDLTKNRLPHIFDGIVYLQPQETNDQLDGAMTSSEETESAEKEIYLRVKKFAKRAEFLHPIPSQNSE